MHSAEFFKEPSKQLRSVLKNAMIDDFWAGKRKNTYTTKGIAKQLANYIICINKRWEYQPQLFWEDYQTYFSDIPIDPPDCR